MAERRRPQESPFPSRIQPMVPAETNQKPFRSNVWICEAKWNGARTIVFIRNPQDIVVRTSSGRNVTENFPELAEGFALLGQRCSMILDGETVSGEGKSKIDLNAVLTRLKSGTKRAEELASTQPCQFVAFDILYLNGQDLTSLSLEERKEKLAEAMSRFHLDGIYVNSFVRRNYNRFIEGLKLGGYEGVIFKKRSSPYLAGRRSTYWLKMKFN